MRNSFQLRFFSRDAGKLVGFVFLVGVLTGCHSPSQYISPQITGRVLDATTHQPLAGATVQRIGVLPANPDPGGQVKGGEILQRDDPIVTGSDGRFELVSLRNVALFRRLSWFTVSINCTRSGYDLFTTNYLYSQSTTNAAGVPLINAGDILMIPAAK